MLLLCYVSIAGWLGVAVVFLGGLRLGLECFACAVCLVILVVYAVLWVLFLRAV